MPTLGNMSKMSFYPTDPEIVKHIARIINNPRPNGFIADFQAGEGDALLSLASALKLKPVANELERNRYATLKAKWQSNPAHLLNADSNDLRVKSYSLSMQFCNPPYQDVNAKEWNGSETARTEVQHATAHISAVAKGGLFVLVCYQHHLGRLAQFIYNYLDDANIYRASTENHLDKYAQIVLIGNVKRYADTAKNRIPELNQSVSRMEDWFKEQSRNPDAFPLLSEEEDGAYTIQSSPYPEAQFLVEAKSPYQRLMQRSQLLEDSASPFNIKPTKLPKPEAITQPRLAHLSSLMASGILNGTIISIDGRDIRLSLTTRIVSIQTEKEPTDNGWTRTTYDKFVPMITLWDQLTGEIQYLTEIDEITEFIDTYRETILDAARRGIKTLYNMGDWKTVYPDLENLMIYGGNKPVKFFPGQIETIAAAAEALRKKGSLILSGEQGIGKSLIGGAIIYKSNVPSDKWVLLINPPALASQTEEELQRLVDPKTNRLPDGRKLNLVKIVTTNKEGEKAIGQFMGAIRSLQDDVKEAKKKGKELAQLNVMIVKLSALKLNNGYSAGVALRKFGTDEFTVDWMKGVARRVAARIGADYYPTMIGRYNSLEVRPESAPDLSDMRGKLNMMRYVLSPYYGGFDQEKSKALAAEYGVTDEAGRERAVEILNKAIGLEERKRRVSINAGMFVMNPTEYHNDNRAAVKHILKLSCPDCGGVVHVTKHNDDLGEMQDALDRKGSNSSDGIICTSKVCDNCGRGFDEELKQCPHCRAKNIETTTYHVCNTRLVQQNHLEKPREKAYKVNPVFWDKSELFDESGKPTAKFAAYMASNDGHLPTRVEISFLIKRYSHLFALAVLDEAHMIRNTETAQSIAMFTAISNIPKRLLMSGTPFNGLASSVRNAMLVTDSSLWEDFAPVKRHDGRTDWKVTVEKFIETYGAKKVVETYTESNGSGKKRSKAKSDNITRVVSEAPGVTPSLLALGVSKMLTVGIHDIRNDMPALRVKFEGVSIANMSWAERYADLEKQMKRAAGEGDRFLGLFMSAYFACVNPHGQTYKDKTLEVDIPWSAEAEATAQELWLHEYIKSHDFGKNGRITIMMHQTATKDHRKRIADALIEARPELSGRIAMLNGTTDTRSEDIRRIWDKGNLIMITNIEKVGLGQNITQSPTIIMLEPAMGSIQFSQSARRAYRVSQYNDCEVIVLYVLESSVHNALVSGVVEKLKAMARMSGYVDQTVDDILGGHDVSSVDGIGQLMKMIANTEGPIVADVPTEAVDISGRKTADVISVEEVIAEVVEEEVIAEVRVEEEAAVEEAVVEDETEDEELPLEQPEQVAWVYAIEPNVATAIKGLGNDHFSSVKVQIAVGKATLYINRFYSENKVNYIAGTVLTSRGTYHAFATSNANFKKIMEHLEANKMQFAAFVVDIPLATLEKQHGPLTSDKVQPGWFN